ncbi:unnamed protein product [Polarella glacialis]|uniref:RING-type E3 ubiquitin transferase n=1 Tax=Polarella glacialis TaxID=89957 RepID=A0A813JKR1_POLGL|nr:unnamed protein product [Polarella glacialis]CAE8680545.1 unnamed protein product [Polarella glacialis]
MKKDSSCWNEAPQIKLLFLLLACTPGTENGHLLSPVLESELFPSLGGSAWLGLAFFRGVSSVARPHPDSDRREGINRELLREICLLLLSNYNDPHRTPSKTVEGSLFERAR